MLNHRGLVGGPFFGGHEVYPAVRINEHSFHLFTFLYSHPFV